MSALQLTLKRNVWSRHNRNPWGVVCHNDECRRHLKVGDEAVSVRVNNHGHHRCLYCVPCAEELNII